jgi:glucose-1-phosphate thymidylyltransferase
MRNNEVIGLIPCGGHATRIAPLPCSKEVLPVGLRKTAEGSLRPKVVSHYLLDKMQRAGVRKAFFILRKGKWDIPDYYGDGASFRMDLGYLVVHPPHGPAYTLDQAYPFVRGARIAFGFPDILFGPSNAFEQALARLTATRSQLVLGLYPVRDRRTKDAVEIDRKGRVREMILNPAETNRKLTWVFGVWTPAFTEFVHEYLAVPRTTQQGSNAMVPVELTVEHAIQAAIRDKLQVQSVVFPRRSYLDIGTPEGLRRVLSCDGLACYCSPAIPQS